MIVINAKDHIAGRLATYAAKKALLGEQIAIVNAEHVYITGTPKTVAEDFLRKRKMGTWATGPFYHRQPDRLLRRIIRGMLPHKQEKGKSAYDRIMCYLGVPEEFKTQKMETIPGAQISKVPNLKYISLKEVCLFLGSKRVSGD